MCPLLAAGGREEGDVSDRRWQEAGIPVAQLAPAVREGTGKKKVGVQVARISKMTDLRSGSSVKPERKSWDDLTVSLGTVTLGSVMKYKSKVDKDTILRTQVQIL